MSAAQLADRWQVWRRLDPTCELHPSSQFQQPRVGRPLLCCRTHRTPLLIVWLHPAHTAICILPVPLLCACRPGGYLIATLPDGKRIVDALAGDQVYESPMLRLEQRWEVGNRGWELGACRPRTHTGTWALPTPHLPCSAKPPFPPSPHPTPPNRLLLLLLLLLLPPPPPPPGAAAHIWVGLCVHHCRHGD